MRLPQPNAGGRLILLPSNQTGLEIVQHAEGVVARIDDAGIRVEQRKARQARQQVRGRR